MLRRALPLCLLTLTAVAGCGTPAYDPAAAIHASGFAMGAVRTVSAAAAFGPGATSFGFALVSAHGVLRVPADSDATVKARRGDTVLDFEVIVLAGHTYLKAPIIGWED